MPDHNSMLNFTFYQQNHRSEIISFEQHWSTMKQMWNWFSWTITFKWTKGNMSFIITIHPDCISNFLMNWKLCEILSTEVMIFSCPCDLIWRLISLRYRTAESYIIISSSALQETGSFMTCCKPTLKVCLFVQNHQGQNYSLQKCSESNFHQTNIFQNI